MEHNIYHSYLVEADDKFFSSAYTDGYEERRIVTKHFIELG